MFYSDFDEIENGGVYESVVDVAADAVFTVVNYALN